MVTRSRSFMVVVYLMLSVAGVFFIISPSASVASATDISSFPRIWGLFYLVGGLTGAAAASLRVAMQNLLATWFFEIAGLALLVIATLIYFVALVMQVTVNNTSVTAGSSFVVLALASSLSVRVGEAAETINIIRRFDRRTGATQKRSTR